MNVPPPQVLVVAGRDPSGAGLDADAEAIFDLGVELHGVATALTEQDANGVRSIGAREPRAWLREAFAFVLRDLGAAKFGLLPGAEQWDPLESTCRHASLSIL